MTDFIDSDEARRLEAAGLLFVQNLALPSICWALGRELPEVAEDLLAMLASWQSRAEDARKQRIVQDLCRVLGEERDSWEAWRASRAADAVGNMLLANTAHTSLRQRIRLLDLLLDRDPGAAEPVVLPFPITPSVN